MHYAKIVLGVGMKFALFMIHNVVYRLISNVLTLWKFLYVEH